MNNKGMTTVEILMVFVIIGIISVGLFSMISSFNTKQNIESAKEKLITFKNTVTRDIEGDIIRKGLVSVVISPVGKENKFTDIFQAKLTFKDGTKKFFVVKKRSFEGNDVSGKEAGQCMGVEPGDAGESFTIEYGAANAAGTAIDNSKKEVYELPDLGESKNDCGHLVKDLRINSVDMVVENNVFMAKIVFYHPDLSTRYSMNIITPVNFDDISGSYNDEAFADATVKLSAASSATGSILAIEGDKNVNRSGTIGTLTLTSSVSTSSLDLLLI